MSGINTRKCCCDCTRCVTGTFAYAFTATLGWDPFGMPDLDLYAFVDGASNVCYYNNLSFATGGIALNHDVFPSCTDTHVTMPEIITGNFTTAHTFRAWYNQFQNCTPEVAPSTAVATITNTGTGTICVNGQNVAPGCSYVAPLPYAGYNTGNQSGYSGTKAVLAVTSGCCP